MKMLYVGDGKRDFVTVPRIVEHILGISIEEDYRRWAHLHGKGKGFDKKLLFATKSAASENSDGIVATIDTDLEKKGERLKKLKSARDQRRAEGLDLPIALGEATPHGEAWLLDDKVAVREILSLDQGTPIPNVARTRNPKKELNKLHKNSPRQNEKSIDVLADIAKLLKVGRCAHSETTGLKAFENDVKQQFASML